MANVTFLGPRGGQYTLGWNGKEYVFPSGETVTNVPPEVAIRCQAKSDSKGKNLFKVDMSPKNPDADVAEILGIQEEFLNWPSSLP